MSKSKKLQKTGGVMCLLSLQDSILNPTDCKTLCVKAEEAGFGAVVLAPTFHRMYPAVTSHENEKNLRASRSLLAGDVSPDFGIDASGVLVIGEGSAIDWGEQIGFLPKDHSEWSGRNVMVRFFTDYPTAGYLQAIRTMANYGLKPVLCLPEILGTVGNEPWRAFLDCGVDVEFAVDLNSLGGNNSVHRDEAVKILETGKVCLLGTRFQLSNEIDECLKGIRLAKDVIGESRVSEILSIDNVSVKTGIFVDRGSGVTHADTEESKAGEVQSETGTDLESNPG